MKSAIELAMAKTEEMVDDQEKLTQEQISAVNDIKSEYEAKWAEQEIVLKQRIEKLQQETDPQTFAEHQRQFHDEMNQIRNKIYGERDQKIEDVRKQRKS